MRKKILHNWGLKLISLVIAFLLWYLAISTDNPKETQTYSNIPVTLKNAELLEQENKVYEILDNTDVVRVSVRAPRSVFEQLRPSDIVAEADMNKLTDINTIAITCQVPNFEVESVTANPSVMRLGIEEKSSRWIRVLYSTTGDVAEGYVIVNTTADQTRIEVSGPKSLMDRVSYAGIQIDVSGASNTQSANAEVVLYDAEGKPIESSSLKKTVDNIRMIVEILPVKEVPVELNVTGAPAEGYLATGVVECNTPSVRIAGSASALANISKISVPAEMLDITGATGNVERAINLRDYLSSSIRFVDNGFSGRVTATVHIEQAVERTMQIQEEGLTVLGLPKGLTYRYAAPGQSYRLTVSGLGADVSALDLSKISCVIDIEQWMEDENMKKLPLGTHVIPVSVTLPEGITAENELFVRLIVEEWEEE